ncbi:MAG: UPF0149 family protein [Candidatus Thiothrix singaporensis]|uniref:UPF0149 family protein n=1 Tax=Candidatus Thiothrix singaporensis TaxID=2799669 RepID=A0A7L6AYB5_9GAMM|nr:MAG: UPF0149 family protein [Candidatus Thiothrix singaporensis]
MVVKSAKVGQSSHNCVFVTEDCVLSDKLPDYLALERALGRADVDIASAEIHGLCCGMLVVSQVAREDAWLAEVLDGDAQDFYVQEARALLRQLFAATRAQLNDPEMGFELFLPDDDALAARLEAVQDWCQGFSYGLALAGVKDMRKLPKDSREWAQDVVKIGASGEFDLDDPEESETALAEIIEYLRVGALMMNEEMQPLKAAPQVH